MGEAASPVCFELAKRLKRAPRQIAQEIATSLPKVAGVSRVEVAGAGYLNIFIDRGMFWANAQENAAAELDTRRLSFLRKQESHSIENAGNAVKVTGLRRNPHGLTRFSAADSINKDDSFLVCEA